MNITVQWRPIDEAARHMQDNYTAIICIVDKAEGVATLLDGIFLFDAESGSFFAESSGRQLADSLVNRGEHLQCFFLRESDLVQCLETASDLQHEWSSIKEPPLFDTDVVLRDANGNTALGKIKQGKIILGYRTHSGIFKPVEWRPVTQS